MDSTINRSEITGHTSITPYHTTYKWTIDNFKCVYKEYIAEDVLKSDTIRANDQSEIFFRVFLFPNTNNSILAEIFFETYTHPTIVQATVSLLNEAGEKCYSKSQHGRIMDDDDEESCLKFTEFVSHTDLRDKTPSLLPEGKLTILTEMDVYVDECCYVVSNTKCTKKNPNELQAAKACEVKLSQDFAQMWKNPKLTDVVLVVKGKEFKAHNPGNKIVS